MYTTRLTVTVALAALLTSNTPLLQAAGPDADALAAARMRGVNFLRTTQADDGSWTQPDAVGITALATTSLLRSGLKVDDPSVAKGLANLETFVHDDGGIYAPESKHRNYETSIALLAFQAANDDGRYTARSSKAVACLKGLQWDESEGLDPSDTAYGGAGYGSHERPDLSNTQFLHRRPQGGRRESGRPGRAERPHLRLPLPEPRKRAQHDPARRQSRTTAGSTTRRPPAAARKAG